MEYLPRFALNNISFVGKYSSTMEHMGIVIICYYVDLSVIRNFMFTSCLMKMMNIHNLLYVEMIDIVDYAKISIVIYIYMI